MQASNKTIQPEPSKGMVRWGKGGSSTTSRTGQITCKQASSDKRPNGFVRLMVSAV